MIGEKFDDDILNRIESIAEAGMEFLKAEGKDGISESEMFRTCNKSTCAYFFNAAFIALVEVVKKIPSVSVNGLSGKIIKNTLDSWEKAITMQNQLIETVKSMTTANKTGILVSCLKYGKMIVDQFYKNAMPLLDRQFKNFPSESRELLKHLQLGTRTMLAVCNHAKTSKDQKLASYVPAVKKTQELLNYRVKAMLTANGCASAFFVGNLKIRDLQGKEIHVESFSGESDNDNDSSIHDSDENSSRNSDNEEQDEDDDVTVVTGDTEDSLSRDYD